MKFAKKGFICLLIAMVIMMMCSLGVFAADSSPTENEIGYTSWGYLGTMGGAMAATLVIVQFLKVPLDSIRKIPTRFFVYFIALLILLFAEYITQGTILFERAGLIVLNAIIVTTAAMGAYEVTFRKLELKQSSA